MAQRMVGLEALAVVFAGAFAGPLAALFTGAEALAGALAAVFTGAVARWGTTRVADVRTTALDGTFTATAARTGTCRTICCPGRNAAEEDTLFQSATCDA